MFYHRQIVFLKNSLMIALTTVMFCLPKVSLSQVNNTSIISKSDSNQSTFSKNLPNCYLFFKIDKSMQSLLLKNQKINQIFQKNFLGK
jgi:hypothetical protein